MRPSSRPVFCVTMRVVNVQWLMSCVCLVALVDTITVTASTPLPDLSPQVPVAASTPLPDRSSQVPVVVSTPLYSRPSQVPVLRSHDKEYQSHFAQHSPQQRTNGETQLNRLRLFRTEEKKSTVDEQNNPESVATRAKVPEGITWPDFLKYVYTMCKTAVGRVAIPPRDSISLNLFPRKSQTTTMVSKVKLTVRNKSLQFPKSLLELKINNDQQTTSVTKPTDRNYVTPKGERNVKMNMTSSQGLDDTGHAEWSMQQGQPWWASERRVASNLPSLPAPSTQSIAVNTTTTVFHLAHQSPDTIHDRENTAVAVSAWSSQTARSEGLLQPEAKPVISLSFSSTRGSRAGRELNTFTASGSTGRTHNTTAGGSTGRTLNTLTADGSTGRTLNTTAGGSTGRTLNATAGGSTGRTLNTTAGGSTGRTLNTTAGGSTWQTLNTTAVGSTGRTLNTPTAGGSAGRTLNTPTAGGSAGRTLNTPTAGGSAGRTFNTPTAGGSAGRTLNTPTAGGSAGRTLNSPTAGGSAGRTLNSPTAGGSAGRTLNTPTAGGSARRTLNTPTAGSSARRTFNTSTAGGSGAQAVWDDEWSRVRRGTGSMIQEGRGQWFSASETCQQLEVVKVLQPSGCVRRVVRSQSCQGTCHSRSVPEWDVERQELRRVAYCTCCKPHSMTYRRIRFRCPGHDKNLAINVGVATQCACRPCSDGTPSLRQPYDY